MEIDFAKAIYGQEEKDAVMRVINSPLLASGPENEAFEKEFSEYVGAKYAILVNSGSSANLLAFTSLYLPKRAKVLSSACGFPATVSPLIHLGLIPVLVDYSLDTCNADLSQVEKEIESCDALILAHTLGNPLDMKRIMDIAEAFHVFIIEDCCEAVGGKVGIYGDLASWSFYPAHQMTALGGGGMVTTNDQILYQRIKSMRDWGKMYDWDSGQGGNITKYDSPIGYHRGYTYQTVGYNFKLPEANAAFGRVQIKRLDEFREARMKNWKYLRDGLKDIKQITISPMSEGASPFGFCMRVKNRNKFGEYLESKGIRHRPFFAGNILRHEPFKHLGNPDDYPVADQLMREALFIGCHPALTKEELNYMVDTIHAYRFDS